MKFSFPKRFGRKFYRAKKLIRQNENSRFYTWTKRISTDLLKQSVENYNLGKGETEALSLALEIVESAVILDDFAARRCARNLHIPFIGTGGLLISAKRRNLIPSVSDALEKVQSEGLWLSDSIVEMLKEKAGE